MYGIVWLILVDLPEKSCIGCVGSGLGFFVANVPSPNWMPLYMYVYIYIQILSWCFSSLKDQERCCFVGKIGWLDRQLRSEVISMVGDFHSFTIG